MYLNLYTGELGSKGNTFALISIQKQGIFFINTYRNLIISLNWEVNGCLGHAHHSPLEIHLAKSHLFEVLCVIISKAISQVLGKGQDIAGWKNILFLMPFLQLFLVSSTRNGVKNIQGRRWSSPEFTGHPKELDSVFASFNQETSPKTERCSVGFD